MENFFIQWYPLPYIALNLDTPLLRTSENCHLETSVFNGFNDFILTARIYRARAALVIKDFSNASIFLCIAAHVWPIKYRATDMLFLVRKCILCIKFFERFVFVTWNVKATTQIFHFKVVLIKCFQDKHSKSVSNCFVLQKNQFKYYKIIILE